MDRPGILEVLASRNASAEDLATNFLRLCWDALVDLSVERVGAAIVQADVDDTYTNKDTVG